MDENKVIGCKSSRLFKVAFCSEEKITLKTHLLVRQMGFDCKCDDVSQWNAKGHI